MGWASEFLHNFPNWASNISYSYVFWGPETFLISAFYLFLSVKYTLSPLRILKFNPKRCFYPQKASYFLWILRYEAGLFLRYFLNFLTFWAWLSYKMVSYKKKLRVIETLAWPFKNKDILKSTIVLIFSNNLSVGALINFVLIKNKV